MESVPGPRVSGKRVGGIPGGHLLRDHPGLTGRHRADGDGGGGHRVGSPIPSMRMGRADDLWLLLVLHRVAYDRGQLLLLLGSESGILLQVHLLRRRGGRGDDGGRRRRGRDCSSASAIIDCGRRFLKVQ